MEREQDIVSLVEYVEVALGMRAVNY